MIQFIGLDGWIGKADMNGESTATSKYLSIHFITADCKKIVKSVRLVI